MKLSSEEELAQQHLKNEAAAEDEKLQAIARSLRKNLKQMSKNQLIAVVFQQINAVSEQRHANQMLLERLRQYEPKNEEVKSEN